MPIEGRVRVDGLDLSYARDGAGPVNVLCLPDVLGSWQLHFKYVLRDFDKSKFTVVCCEAVGFGKSRPPTRADWLSRSRDESANRRDGRLAHRLMLTLGLDSYSVLGYGDGGVTALFLAAEQPRAVRRLVIWGTSAYVTEYELSNHAPARSIETWSEQKRQLYVDYYGEKYTQDCWSDYIDTLIELYRERGGNKCRELFLKEGTIKQPVLILYGNMGMMVPKSAVEYLEENLNATVETVSDGMHDLHLTKNKWFRKVVSDFLTDYQSQKQLASSSDEDDDYETARRRRTKLTHPPDM